MTRDEILERIWGKGVFIDVDAGINAAVRKVRRALNDDAEAPRFVVTVPAKGYRFVAPVSEVSAGVSQVRPQQSSFVGREREVAELRAGLADAAAGRGRLFLISGEPGIGKTRIADELSAHARQQGARVIWGRCWNDRGVPAYWPWVQVFRSCLEDAETRITVPRDYDAPQVSDLLPEIVQNQLISRATSARPPSDPEQARFRLFDSAARLLKNVARNDPLVIVLDDLHDADQSSLLLLRFIAGELRQTRILLVASYRDTEVRDSPALSRLIAELVREGSEMPLGGLSKSEVASFVTERTRAVPDPELVTALHRSTGGNPLFLDGVVRMMPMEEDGQGAEQPTGGGFRIPRGVREAIRLRLSVLTPQALSILSTAAVIGREFDLMCLQEASATGLDPVLSVLDEARQNAIIGESASAVGRYRFLHDLIRDTIYEDLASPNRLRLHQRVGETIEHVYTKHLALHLAALAQHFCKAAPLGQAAKAIDYSVQAGDAALAVFAYEEAARHWQTALDLIQQYGVDSARRADLLRSLGTLICDTASQVEGIAYLEAALKIYTRLGDRHDAALVHSDLGLAKSHARFGPQANVAEALAHYREADALLEKGRDPRATAKLYQGITIAAVETNQTDEGLAASDHAMEIYKRLGDHPLWSVTASHRARLLMLRGRLAEATSLLEQVCAVALTIPDPEASRDALWSAAWYYKVMHDPQEARRLFVLGMERPGLSSFQRSWHLEFLALIECELGNLKKAKEIIGQNRVNPMFRAAILWREGDFDASWEMLLGHLEWARRGGRFHVCATLQAMLELLHTIGDHEAAADILRQLLAAYDERDIFWEIAVRPLAVFLAIQAGRPEEAVRHLECCRRVVAEGENWFGWDGCVERAEAAVAAADGRFTDAGRHFNATLENCRRLALPFDAADTLHDWGRVLLDAGDRVPAIEKLDAAVELYRRHGAGQRWIDRVMADRMRADDS